MFFSNIFELLLPLLLQFVKCFPVLLGLLSLVSELIPFSLVNLLSQKPTSKIILARIEIYSAKFLKSWNIGTSLSKFCFRVCAMSKFLPYFYYKNLSSCIYVH